MAINLNQNIKDKLSEDIIQQQIIAEIEGIDYVFGTSHVTAPIRIGDNINIGEEGFLIGGNRNLENSLPLIDHKKLTRSITQRISESEGITSITSMNLNLVDEDSILSEAFSPTDSYDILGSKCTVYSSFIGSSHPDESIVLFKGIISSVKFEASSVNLKVVHPEKLKQQTLFIKTETTLTSALNASSTTVNIDYKDTILRPFDALECYVRINDELIKFDSITNGNLTSCSRGQLNTIAASHDSGDDVETFYVLKGNPIDLTLKLLLSQNYDKYDDGLEFFTGFDVSSINRLSANESLSNSIIFNKEDFEKLNIQVGDLVDLYNVDDIASYPSGNILTSKTIQSIGSNDTNAWIVLNEYLETDYQNKYKVDFTSQYANLTDGCALEPDLVDIEGMNSIKNLYSNQMVDCEIYIRDTIENAKEFIDKIILRPQGLLSVPRKGRISVNKTSAPLADNNTVTLNKDNITNAKSLGSVRDIDNGFYNSIIYKTNEDSLEEKFLRTDIFADLESETKIKVGKRPLVIEAKSLKDNEDTQRFIKIQAENLLATYKFGAEQIEIETNYATGIPIEVGDSVICDLNDLNVTDLSTASKTYIPRVMRVKNKTLDLIGNKVKLSLESTIYKSSGRYGTIAPSSLINSGSTTSLINLKQSFGNRDTYEKEKWVRYIGQKVRIKAPDYSFDETVTLLGVDIILDQILITPLSQAPNADYILCPPNYDDSDPIEMAFWKNLHVFINPSVKVVSGVDNFSFTVDSSDIDKFLIGAIVKLKNDDRSSISDEFKVDEINSNTITIDGDLGFTPDNTYTIELIGFKDGGLPYRIL